MIILQNLRIDKAAPNSSYKPLKQRIATTIMGSLKDATR